MNNKTYILHICIMLLIFSINTSSCNNSNKIEQIHNEKNAKGHLEIDSSKYSFGIVHKSNQKNILCSFNLKNTGAKLLVIQKIDASCGCVSIRSYPKVIEPNESKTLYVEISTERQFGVFNKVIFINSNADNPLELVRIKGEIQE